MKPLAVMTLQELEAHGAAVAARYDNPAPHVCVNADTCTAHEAQRGALREELAAARAEWLRRKRTARSLAS